MKINVRTGHVVYARMGKSTGSWLLDDAAVETVYQWRYKPGTISPNALGVPQSAIPHTEDEAIFKFSVSFELREN